MAARSGTCAMCAAAWEGGEEADWRGDVGCTAGGCRKRGNKKAYSTQCSQVISSSSVHLIALPDVKVGLRGTTAKSGYLCVLRTA